MRNVFQKMLMAIGLVTSLAVGGAIADFAVTVGSGTTIFAFTCFVSKVCTGSVPITSAGVEILPATAAKQDTGNTSLSTIATAVQAAIPAGTNTIGTVGQLPYPVGSTPYTASTTGTTTATTATLTGASSVTTYLCGFSIRANATSASTGDATVTGIISGTLHFTQWTAPAASGLGITEMVFMPCLPASTTSTSVAIVSAAPGSGGVVSVSAWGYKL